MDNELFEHVVREDNEVPFDISPEKETKVDDELNPDKKEEAPLDNNPEVPQNNQKEPSETKTDDKVYFGMKDDSNYYYLVDSGSDIVILDVSDVKVFSSKEAGLDYSDKRSIVIEAWKALGIVNVNFDIVIKYVVDPVLKPKENSNNKKKSDEIESEVKDSVPKEELDAEASGEPAV